VGRTAEESNHDDYHDDGDQGAVREDHAATGGAGCSGEGAVDCSGAGVAAVACEREVAVVCHVCVFQSSWLCSWVGCAVSRDKFESRPDGTVEANDRGTSTAGWEMWKMKDR
jgi:hypothetical protein